MWSNWIVNLHKKVKQSFSKAHALLGVDLDLENGSARIVQLGCNNESYILEQCVVIEGFSARNLTESNEDIIAELSYALKQAVDQSGCASKKVAAALPYSAVISKEITLSCNLNPAELNNFLQVNLGKYVNYVTDAMRFDYQVLHERENFMQVFLVAARKLQQTQLINIIKAANLVPKIIDVDVYALARAAKFLLAAQTTGSVAIINFSDNGLLFCILHGENVLHVQSEAVAISKKNNNQDVTAAFTNNNLQNWLKQMPQQVELILLCGECGGKLCYCSKV
jgi:type IV pilus assembly protein PilM